MGVCTADQGLSLCREEFLRSAEILYGLQGSVGIADGIVVLLPGILVAFVLCINHIVPVCILQGETGVVRVILPLVIYIVGRHFAHAHVCPVRISRHKELVYLLRSVQFRTVVRQFIEKLRASRKGAQNRTGKYQSDYISCIHIFRYQF